MQNTYYDFADSLALTLVRDFAQSIIASRPPNQVIERGPGDPYMERWMLGRKLSVPTFVSSSRYQAPDNPTPVPSEIENVFVHRFLRDDQEDVHCHPWWNLSVPLSGGYIEADADGRREKREAGGWVFRKAEERHAIVEVIPGTVSLFITGPKEREWGFWPDPETFVHHLDYAQWRRDHAAAGETV